VARTGKIAGSLHEQNEKGRIHRRTETIKIVTIVGEMAWDEDRDLKASHRKKESHNWSKTAQERGNRIGSTKRRNLTREFQMTGIGRKGEMEMERWKRKGGVET
jgi:hypothetical protein